ncbi:hypothetical protein [uncultured Paludibaculum sp.]|uniref:hypothetical protein n=1 Tax=uncultured Paludibaculum sp. TaxID=1765020 RepID=UPI002AAAB3C2|nr:hypothetical protein [uncultured Paludibaculum sp.]
MTIRNLPALARTAAFLFVGLLVCPLRYFSLAQENIIDTSWVYAMNLVPLLNLRFGVDVIWTTGPLAYLFHPLDIGNNLVNGLIAQAAVWLVMLWVMADLVFLAAVPPRNLAAFAVCVALASPIFRFNFMGVENLLLLAILTLSSLLLLRPFLWRRFLLLLLLIPPILLIKGTGAAIALGILGGLFAALALRRDWRRVFAGSVVAFAAIPLIALVCFRMSAGTWSMGPYLQGLMEISSEYSVLLAGDGPWDEKVRAAVVFAAFVGLFVMAFRARQTHWILCLSFAIPLLVSIKHGFVRQDIHTVNFFCMALLLLGLLLLYTGSWRFNRNFPLVLMLMVAISLQSIQWRLGWAYLWDVSGWNNVQSIAGALDLSATRAKFTRERPPGSLPVLFLDGPMLHAIGQRTVGILSPVLIYAAWNHLDLRTMPVPQGYQCNQKLDLIDADWLEKKGPQRLLVEWFAIDGRHPLGENPATLLSIYKWYELELLESDHLLLRRRDRPRAVRLESLRTETIDISKGIDIPDSAEPLFVRANFELSPLGRLAKVLYHIPEMHMAVSPAPEAESRYRVIAGSLASPLLISHLPTNLSAAATLFDGRPTANPKLMRVAFSGPGLSYYQQTCQIEFLRMTSSER